MAKSVQPKGFRVPRRTALVVFDKGTEFEGAELRMKLDRPMGEIIALSRETESGDLESTCKYLGEMLLGWNLEDDDGSPLPANEEGVLQLPPAFVTAVFAKWIEAQTGVARPLGQPSSDGSTSEAE